MLDILLKVENEIIQFSHKQQSRSYQGQEHMKIKRLFNLIKVENIILAIIATLRPKYLILPDPKDFTNQVKVKLIQLPKYLDQGSINL